MDLKKLINDVKKEYELENKRINQSHKAKLLEFEALEKANKKEYSEYETASYGVDYKSKYKKRYSASLKEILEIYDAVSQIFDDSYAYNFNSKNYIKKLKPRKIINPEVSFKELTDEYNGFMKFLEGDYSVKEGIERFKSLCQVIVDLKYINDNADDLLFQSLIVDEERKAWLSNYTKAYEAKANKINHDKKLYLDKYLEKSKIENYDCYPLISKLKDSVNSYIEINKKNNEDKLGNGSFKNKYDLSLLIGYTSQKKFAKEEIEFVKQLLGLDMEFADTSKAVFNLNKNSGTIVISAKDKEMDDLSVYWLLEEIYLQMATRFPKGKLKFAGVDCSNRKISAVSNLNARIQNFLGADSIYMPFSRNGEASKKLINALSNEVSKRAHIYADKEIYSNGIYEYNEKYSDEAHDFIFVAVDGYPKGFEDYRNQKEDNTPLEMLVKDTNTGVIMVIIQNEDTSKFGNDVKYIDPIKYGCEHIKNIDAKNKTFLLNDVLVGGDIYADGFKASNVWDGLKKNFQTKEVVEKKKVKNVFIENLVEDYLEQNPNRKPFTSAIQVPVGREDNDNIRCIDLNLNSCNMLVVGQMGKGKSTFLHTLIHSASLLYTPEEVEFYITDFKTNSDGAEFRAYTKGAERYIPHVKFLSIRNNAGNATEVLDTINEILEERNLSFGKAGNNVKNIDDYNKSDAVRNGKLKKMSRLIFIIDEYNTFLCAGSDGKNPNMDLVDYLHDLLHRGRSFGVSILLSGQEVLAVLKAEAFHISICYGGNKQWASMFKGLTLSIDPFTLDKFIALIKNDNANISEIERKVRIAYAGDTKQNDELTRIINQNNPGVYHQILAGSIDSSYINEEELGNINIKINNIINSEYFFNIPIFLGQSSINTRPSEFILGPNETSSLFTFMNKQKTRVVQRNIMLSFYYYNKKRNKTTYLGEPKIYFSSVLTDAYDRFDKTSLDDITRYNCLNKDIYIEEIKKKYDSCKRILEIGEILEKREIAVENCEDIELNPILLVINKAEWLLDRGYAKQLDSSKKIESKKEPPKKIENNSKYFNKEDSELFDFIMNVPSEPKEEKVEHIFTENDVKGTLRNIYDKGYKYNVFIVVSFTSGKVNAIKELLPNVIYTVGIYDSVDAYRDVAKTSTTVNICKFDGDENCCYICPSNYVVRLYDLDDDKSKPFLNEISKL